MPETATKTQNPTTTREPANFVDCEAHSDPTARAQNRIAPARWKAAVAPFETPHAGKATWQLATTIGSYVGAWYLIYLSLSISWWLTVPLAVLTGGLMVRVFIIFHDCGHGSFFASRKANTFWAFVTAVLTFTPHLQWRAEHAAHHGQTGDLNRRGMGDIWTLTIAEYHALPRWKRRAYHFVRHPLVLFGIAPIMLLLILQRIPKSRSKPNERRSVWLINATLALAVTGMILWLGVADYLITQLIILQVAGSVGIWLFYLQHQYEDAYWERGDDWDYGAAALHGSSYLKLPRVLQWFSGNIGFHHVHHLSPRIPNYNLERCHNSDSLFQSVEPMTLRTSLPSLSHRLWDESTKKLISFRELRQSANASS